MQRIDHVVYAVRDLDVAARAVPRGARARLDPRRRAPPMGDREPDRAAGRRPTSSCSPSSTRSVAARRSAPIVCWRLTADGDRWYRDLRRGRRRRGDRRPARPRGRRRARGPAPTAPRSGGAAPGSTIPPVTRGCRSSSRGTCPTSCCRAAPSAPPHPSGAAGIAGWRSAATPTRSAHGSGAPTSRSRWSATSPGSVRCGSSTDRGDARPRRLGERPRRGRRSGRRGARCPTESRTSSSGTSSGDPATLAWVIGPGTSISDSTPPSDSARKKSSVRRATSSASSRRSDRERHHAAEVRPSGARRRRVRGAPRAPGSSTRGHLRVAREERRRPPPRLAQCARIRTASVFRPRSAR